MSKSKGKSQRRITAAMESGLKVLSTGEAWFYDLVKVGCNGVCIASLVRHGLCTKHETEVSKTWRITEAGRAAYESGYYTPAETRQGEGS